MKAVLRRRPSADRTASRDRRPAGCADRLKRATTVLPVGIREVDVEAAARRVVGREREAEETALAAARDRARQIEEVRGEHHAVADRADAPALLDDELDGRIGRVLHEANGRGEAGRIHGGTQKGLRLAGHGPRQEQEHEDRVDPDCRRRPPFKVAACGVRAFDRTGDAIGHSCFVQL